MSNPYASPEQQQDDHQSSVLSVDIAADVRGMQIVTLALAAGACTLFLIMLVINAGAIDGEPDITSWIGLGMAGFMFVNHLVVPRAIVKSQLQKLNSKSLLTFTDEEKVAAALGPIRGGHIIGCAMLEGAAFMNLIFYMTTSFIGNLMAAAVLIVFLLLKVPTLHGMQNKVTNQLREIEMR